MINMQNVACTASFMTVGMLTVNRSNKALGDDIYAKWAQGAVELHLELCQYAELSEYIVEFVSKVCHIDFPGVYDYEVSEPFGIWFAEQLFGEGSAPTSVKAKEKLAKLAANFFIYPKDAFEAGVLYGKILEHLK